MTDPMLHNLSAERWRQTSSERKRQQRQSEKNKRFRKVPVEITQQPVKKRSVYMGRVTYEWKSGPKRGQKVSIPITLKQPARLSLRGKDVMVKPRDGDMYAWGQKETEEPAGVQKLKDHESKPLPAKKREKRLRDQLKEKFDALIADRGPLEAGKVMARGFVQAHNKMGGKTAKRALAKVYGAVLASNKAAHLSFGRAVRKSASLTTRKPAPPAPVKGSAMNDDSHSDKVTARLIAAMTLLAAADELDEDPGVEVSAFLNKLKKSITRKLAQRKEQKTADQYRKDTGKCPDGYQYNQKKRKCEPGSAPPKAPEQEPVKKTPAKKSPVKKVAPVKKESAPAKKTKAAPKTGAVPAKKAAKKSPVKKAVPKEKVTTAPASTKKAAKGKGAPAPEGKAKGKGKSKKASSPPPFVSEADRVRKGAADARRAKRNAKKAAKWRESVAKEATKKDTPKAKAPKKKIPRRAPKIKEPTAKAKKPKTAPKAKPETKSDAPAPATEKKTKAPAKPKTSKAKQPVKGPLNLGILESL